MTILFLQTRKAEVRNVYSLVEHNLPLAYADHQSLLTKKNFIDSATAKGYKCARTKATGIVNYALKPYYHEQTVTAMQSGPYSITTDGSNDIGTQHSF